MSTVRESNPWWAMTSAENALGIDSHPFTTASPRAQIVFSVFSLTSLSSPSGAELGTAHHPEIAPATDSQILGLLEVRDGRDVRLRVREVGLHRPDREAELLADRLEPLVTPVDRRDLGPAEVRLEEVHARGLDAEDVVGIQGVAPQLEGRAVRGGPARLPVDEGEAFLVRPKAEVGRDPHRRALKVEDLRPVLDRPVLGRGLADLAGERQVEEVPQAHGDVPAERLPRLRLELHPVLVLEERGRFWRVVVVARLGGTPLAPHPLDDVGDEGLDGDVPALGEGVQGHLDRVVHDAPGPLLAGGELLQDVKPSDLRGRRRVPASPGAVIVVVVLALALLKGVVAAPRPGEVVGELRQLFFAASDSAAAASFFTVSSVRAFLSISCADAVAVSVSETRRIPRIRSILVSPSRVEWCGAARV